MARAELADMTDVGHEIRLLRRRRKLGQAALARRARTTQAAISEIETGKRDPTFSTLQRIAKVLRVEIEFTLAP